MKTRGPQSTTRRFPSRTMDARGSIASNDAALRHRCFKVLRPEGTNALERLRLPPLLLSFCLLLLSICPINASIISVTTTNDTGSGSLRYAILQSNTNPGPDIVEFHIPGTKAWGIRPATVLPDVTEMVTIDATTQTGYSNQPVVLLDGRSVSSGSGLSLKSGMSTVQGLAIGGFSGYGIDIVGAPSNTIRACFIGTDLSGTNVLRNAMGGIHIRRSAGNFIGGDEPNSGNLISGNTAYGILIEDSPQCLWNTIAGNRIGTTLTGTARLPNFKEGIAMVNGVSNRIGGFTTAERNIISGNNGNGIAISGAYCSNNIITGNYIGTDVSGSLALSNGADGIVIISGASYNQIGGTEPGAGNLVSGNLVNGIDFSLGANLNQVSGNWVGLKAGGLAALPNGAVGIAISSSTNNLIGGSTSGAGNIVSGNRQSGVYLSGSAVRSNRFEGNWIGVDATGANAIPNNTSGITISGGVGNTIGSSTPGGGNVVSGNLINGILLDGASANLILGNFVGTDPLGIRKLGNGSVWHGIVLAESTGNQIGGAGSSSRNVVSGNYYGILVYGGGSSNNVIRGNFVGLDGTGMQPLGNSSDGISIRSSGTSPTQAPRNNTIGGSEPGAGNIISGNVLSGVYLTNSHGNTFLGNWVGLKADGVGSMPNGAHGLEFDQSEYNQIGGTDPAAANRIAFAAGVRSGVRIRSGAHNVVLGNSIYSNTGLGIGLGMKSVGNQISPNDPCDADTGANQLQNFPDLSSAFSDHSATLVKGRLDTVANKALLLQFYASPATNSTGYGEGQLFLGSTLVSASPRCTNEFSALLPLIPVGWFLSATATDSTNNTSEFSRSIPVAATPALSLRSVAASQSTIGWSASLDSFKIEQASNLVPPVLWFQSGIPISSNSGRFSATLTNSGADRFFRLVPK